jgi:hypothetical protein
MSNVLPIYEQYLKLMCVCVVIGLFVGQKPYFGSRKLCLFSTNQGLIWTILIRN